MFFQAKVNPRNGFEMFNIAIFTLIMDNIY